VQEPIEDTYDEIELIGFSVSMSLFDLLKTRFRGSIYSRHLKDHVGKTIHILGNLVTLKNVRTVKKEWMHFGCFLDIEGEFFDTVNFPDSLKKYPFRGHGIYLILGKVVEECGFPSIEVHKMAKLPMKEDPRF
jgi:DNA polymerase-3 subunit alpha